MYKKEIKRNKVICKTATKKYFISFNFLYLIFCTTDNSLKQYGPHSSIYNSTSNIYTTQLSLKQL